MTRSFESDATNAGSHDDAEWFAPIFARTRTFHHPTAPVAYDCVKVIIVRDGSVILYSEFGQRPVNVGDAVLLGKRAVRRHARRTRHRHNDLRGYRLPD